MVISYRRWSAAAVPCQHSSAAAVLYQHSRAAAVLSQDWSTAVASCPAWLAVAAPCRPDGKTLKPTCGRRRAPFCICCAPAASGPACSATPFCHARASTNIFRKFQRDGAWEAIWAELHMALRGAAELTGEPLGCDSRQSIGQIRLKRGSRDT